MQHGVFKQALQRGGYLISIVCNNQGVCVLALLMLIKIPQRQAASRLRVKIEFCIYAVHLIKGYNQPQTVCFSLNYPLIQLVP